MWMLLYVRFASVYISALVTVVLVVWMVFAVSKTIIFMKSILVDTDPRTVRRYERLRHVLIFTSIMGVATVSSITFVLPFLASSFNKIDENPWGVYLGVFHDLIVYLTLLGVAYLWRPQANSNEDTYLTALLLNYPDLADIDDDHANQIEAQANSDNGPSFDILSNND